MKAKIDWANSYTPVSVQFDDIYFAKENGLLESRHAFVQPANLNELAQKQNHIHIAELGFGTGLNFCLSVQDFLRTKASRLYYSAIDRYPLAPSQLRDCLSCWPELSKVAEELLEKYVDFPPGFYRLELFDARVILDLYLTDVQEALYNFSSEVDVWYLDGFSPKKNPEMWSSEVFDWISTFSRIETKVCTYASTAEVRRRLEARGFEVHKFKGFGKRRESMYAVSKYGLDKKRKIRTQNEVKIIGAGIAGISLAVQFAKRGIPSSLYDRHPLPGQEASGNRSALVMPNLEKTWSRNTQLSLSSYFFSREFFKAHDWQDLELFFLSRERSRAERNKCIAEYARDRLPGFVLLSESQTTERAGVPLNSESLDFRMAGKLQPEKFFESALKKYSHLIRFEQKEVAASEVPQDSFLCTAGEVKRIDVLSQLPIRLKRGQVTEFLSSALPELRSGLSFGGYLIPGDLTHSLGSTYDSEDLDLSTRVEDNWEMFERLNSCLAHPLNRSEWPEFIHSRASIRASLRDGLPLVGEMGSYWLNAGYGSRGFTLAPWCSEWLVATALGEPKPPGRAFESLIEARRLFKRMKEVGKVSSLF